MAAQQSCRVTCFPGGSASSDGRERNAIQDENRNKHKTMLHPNERHTLFMGVLLGEQSVVKDAAWLSSLCGMRLLQLHRGYKALTGGRVSLLDYSSAELRSKLCSFSLSTSPSLSSSLFASQFLLLLRLYDSEYRWNQRSSRCD